MSGRRMSLLYLSVVCALIAVLAIYGFSASKSGNPSLQSIDTQKLTEMINDKDNMVIVDLREEELFAAGRIKGSNNIPFADIQSRYAELPKSKKIVFVCHTGRMGTESGTLLLEKGYKQVFNLEGGMAKWTGEIVK